ncbi:MAG: hypothetical protein ABR881_11580 [Candidatus Sulfotelmatobacter sp.]|jgi:hypothetical protein
MKYETPNLVVLPLAIEAIQGSSKLNAGSEPVHEIVTAYEDWE